MKCWSSRVCWKWRLKMLEAERDGSLSLAPRDWILETKSERRGSLTKFKNRYHYSWCLFKLKLEKECGHGKSKTCCTPPLEVLQHYTRSCYSHLYFWERTVTRGHFWAFERTNYAVVLLARTLDRVELVKKGILKNEPFLYVIATEYDRGSCLSSKRPS